MARTTVTLDDALLRQVKTMAAQQDRTMSEVLENLLRRALAHDNQKPYTLRIKGWPLGVPDDIVCDRDRLYDWFDGRR